MKRIFSLIACLFLSGSAAISFSAAASSLPDWQDPQIVQRNRIPMSSHFETDGLKLMLNGEWNFRWYETIGERSAEFHRTDFDASAWDTMPVPGMWELNGYGDPVYLNVGFAWRGHYSNNPPIPADWHNHAGQYRRTFVLDEGWKGKDVFLHIGAVSSNVRVWVNGKEIGYSEDSKLAARFNITKAVKTGENLIALEVFRWCDGSYLEDQDFWRLTGISRDVYIYSREKDRIEDIRVIASADGKAAICTEVSKGVTSVSYSISDPYGKQIAEWNVPVMAKETSEHGHRIVRTEASVQNVLQWTAETPCLYTLKISSHSRKGMTESTSIEIGFRDVCVSGGQFLVNGKPVLIKGVNRHEMNPYKGYVVSEADMIQDILIMKKLNVNAVRTCHYPDDPLWYSLCDRYGLYVVDEANIESHGLKDGPLNVAKNPDFEIAHLERISRVVKRDFNHPSIITWSLGNEAGDGPNFVKGYELVKKLDPSRPVQYEHAFGAAHTDIICPMYWDHAKCERFANAGFDRPLIQCEYAHAMGNSLGGLKEYWDLIRKYPAYQGGFIWDFVDQALWWPVDAEKYGTDHIFVYGGDFNDYDPSDNSFCCNGIIAADRTLHPHAYEVAYQYRSIHTSAAPEEALNGKVEVFNEYFFIDLSRYMMNWDIEADGRKVLSGCVPSLGLAPQEKMVVDLGFSQEDILEAAGISNIDSHDIYLNVRYALKKADGLLEAGSEISYDQICLHEADFEGFENGSGAPSVHIEGDAHIFAGLMTWEGSDNDRAMPWSLTFNKASGLIESYKIGEKEMLESSLRPNFGRAGIENDLGAGQDRRCAVWRNAELKVRTADVKLLEDRHEAVVEFEPIGSAVVRMTYSIYADGKVLVTEELLDNDGKLSEMPMLPRFGMEFAMNGAYSTFEFFGLGPHENYIDRSSSAIVGHYVQRVEDQYHYGYVRPQESGTKTQLRWMKVLDGNGAGFEIRSDVRFSGSALPFHWKGMDVRFLGNNQAHSLELKKAAHENERSLGRTWVNMDLAQMGLGCVTSWGAWPLEEHLIKARPYIFTISLCPVGN